MQIKLSQDEEYMLRMIHENIDLKSRHHGERVNGRSTSETAYNILAITIRSIYQDYANTNKLKAVK